MTEPATGMTKKLAAFAAQVDAASIPGEIYEHAKVAFLDYLAVTLGGLDDPLVGKLQFYADQMGGNPHATVIGLGRKATLEQAALINGAASHALDYDDTLVSFLGHPSVTLFPSLMALAEYGQKSGQDFLCAYLVGLQVGGTVGACAGLDHYLAGWHATSTLGHIASAAGCARLLSANEDEMINALGISATQSSGLKRNFGTMCKPFHAGRASSAGLLSALLAKEGFTSADDILEGPQGFFAALGGKVNQDILDMLGLGWDVVNLSQKYHASCHATHSPLEAARQLVLENRIPVTDIERIRVHASEVTMQAAANPAPKTGKDAKFSVAYCVANAILQGPTGMAGFTDDRVSDPEVTALMNKVELFADDEMKGLESQVELFTTGGKSFEGFSDILQQIPALADKKSRVQDKFMDLALPVIGKEKAEGLANMVWRLEKISDMQDVAALL